MAAHAATNITTTRTAAFTGGQPNQQQRGKKTPRHD